MYVYRLYKDSMLWSFSDFVVFNSCLSYNAGVRVNYEWFTKLKIEVAAII